MIRTVTLNTGFDETIWVGPVDAGGVGDILERSTLPSGKGINSARVIRALGVPVVAYGLLGEAEMPVFHEALAAEGVDVRLVGVPHRTRTNVTIASASGGATHYRAPGFSLTDPAPVEALTAALDRDVRTGDVVTLHGSTPDGAPVDTWSRIAECASRRGAMVLADVYGEPLLRLLHRVKVVACKPNAFEMMVFPGVGAGVPGAIAAVRHMVAAGVEVPLVTLGATGIVFGEGETISQASLPPAVVARVVGAGDAAMAGLTAALARGLRDIRTVITAAITTAVAHVEGTPLPALAARAAELVPGVHVLTLDSGR